LSIRVEGPCFESGRHWQEQRRCWNVIDDSWDRAKFGRIQLGDMCGRAAELWLRAASNIGSISIATSKSRTRRSEDVGRPTGSGSGSGHRRKALLFEDRPRVAANATGGLLRKKQGRPRVESRTSRGASEARVARNRRALQTRDFIKLLRCFRPTGREGGFYRGSERGAGWFKTATRSVGRGFAARNLGCERARCPFTSVSGGTIEKATSVIGCAAVSSRGERRYMGGR